MQGALARCKVDWLQSGQKNMSYFLRMEKHRGNSRNIRRLRINEMVTTTNEEKIKAELYRFFKNLYTLDVHTADPTYLEGINLPQLSLRDREWIDRFLDLDEIEDSIKNVIM